VLSRSKPISSTRSMVARKLGLGFAEAPQSASALIARKSGISCCDALSISAVGGLTAVSPRAIA